MTLSLDPDGLTRLLCGLIWFTMSLAFSVEVCALLGWLIGEAERGGYVGAVLNMIFWCWILRQQCQHPRDE
ncbi:hypothetical protein GL279_05130 [Paracoccus limosus]|uniref:Uncharacterized protein n=1 Tax=Paracoccus limosus TaxID=913252 RepID=A0A844GZB9_9RHOB|nr:hypothetical protein [Paracoccus limosus]MTH33979.1 hypothetical protein [Paracoccus limosus]